MAWRAPRALTVRTFCLFSFVACGCLALPGSHAQAGTVASLYLGVGDELFGYGGDWSTVDALPNSLNRFVSMTAAPATFSPDGSELSSLLSTRTLVGLTTADFPGEGDVSAVYIQKAKRNQQNTQPDPQRHTRSSNHSSQRTGTSLKKTAKLLKWLQRNPNGQLNVYVTTTDGIFQGILSRIDTQSISDFVPSDLITGVLAPCVLTPDQVAGLPPLLLEDSTTPPVLDEPLPSTPDRTGSPVHAPEPASLTLLLIGGVTTALYSQRRRTRAA